MLHATLLFVLLAALATRGTVSATTLDLDLFNETCTKRPQWCKGTGVELPGGCYGSWPCATKAPCLGSPEYDTLKAELEVGMANRTLDEVIVASR